MKKIINHYKEILILFHINIQKFRRKNFLGIFYEISYLFWNSKMGGLRYAEAYFPKYRVYIIDFLKLIFNFKN